MSISVKLALIFSRMNRDINTLFFNEYGPSFFSGTDAEKEALNKSSSSDAAAAAAAVDAK